MRKHLIVGLTGSFGSGKTTVARILKQLGAKKVVSADELAREAFSSKSGCLKNIKSLFQNKMLNRKKIARIIFSSPKKRKALEAIIHPYVKRRILKEVGTVKRGIVILEVPLLFEAKFDRLCDVTIAVAADRQNRVKWLTRSGFSRSEILSRLRAQLPEREKMKKSDFIIDNQGSKKLLQKRTKSVWQQLKLELEG